MIKQLNIRDFAIIDEIELNFSKGMTVFTGETGTGKSILVDALGLVLGDRADSQVIKGDKERAEITAVFDVSSCNSVIGLLNEQAIECEDDEIYIRRVISHDGKSRAFINDSPVTAQFLRLIGEHLIDIHGQHAHQSLTKTENQKLLLDEYGKYWTQLEAVRRVFDEWSDATAKLKSLLDNNTDKDAVISLLRYQVEELASIKPEPDEYEVLDEEHRRLANSNKLLETTQKALYALREDDYSLLSRLYNLTNELRELQQYDESLSNLIRIIDDASIQVAEASDELRTYTDNLNLDPERLEEVESRISTLHGMARKHHVQPNELADHLVQLEQQLNELENSQQLINELLEKQKKSLNKYRTLAGELHDSRVSAAKKMSHDVTVKLADLGIPNGNFVIDIDNFTDQIPRPGGLDKIEFMISTNPGQKPLPLRKIASGGELSRISLAIQVIGSNRESVPTMIFDEVDAGIGGGIAEIVGKLLRTLGKKCQVFCVTHLPQVASQGDHHVQVNKSSTKTTTSTQVKLLDPGERVEEIARMLGGLKITEQSRKHAKEMLAVSD